MTDIVLYNMFGCEIDRVSVETRDEALEVIKRWLDTIDAGDTIAFESSDEE